MGVPYGWTQKHINDQVFLLEQKTAEMGKQIEELRMLVASLEARKADRRGRKRTGANTG